MLSSHLEWQLEPLFHESSFGYHPGRSAHDAVALRHRNCFNYDFAIDLDINPTSITSRSRIAFKGSSALLKGQMGAGVCGTMAQGRHLALRGQTEGIKVPCRAE